MKKVYKISLVGMLLIGIFDIAISIVSWHIDLDLKILSIISYIIYGSFGFIATKNYNLKAGVAVAAAIGFFDSTIGWWLSIFLKANTGILETNPSVMMWVIVSILVTGTAALSGLLGGAIAILMKRKAAV